MISLRDVDVTYDFRTDSPNRDPDLHSKVLRSYHHALWTKPLPSGDLLELDASRTKPYLAHHGGGGETYVLTSDTMMNSHRGKLREFISAIPEEQWVEYFHVGHTIGGRMVFPGLRVEGRQTFNQRRGTHPRIRDRFDLSLECIRRHYSGEASPLSETLMAARAFFNLFGDFRSYIAFFLLDDYLDANGSVLLFAPHDGFDSSPLPNTPEDYRRYIALQIATAQKRNARIQAYIEEERQRSVS